MTRTHAAVQLLRLGPLTRAEFIAITGWSVKRADETLQLLREGGAIEYSGTSQRGVYWVKGRNKWTSKITVDGREVHIGFFDCPVAASKAYQAKKEEVHFQ